MQKFWLCWKGKEPDLKENDKTFPDCTQDKLGLTDG